MSYNHGKKKKWESWAEKGIHGKNFFCSFFNCRLKLIGSLLNLLLEFLPLRLLFLTTIRNSDISTI